MAFSKQVWDQLRALRIEDFIAALERDGFKPDPAASGAVQAYIRKEKPANRRIVLHYHRGKSWGAKFLKGLIDDAGWMLSDLVRLGLVSGVGARELPSPAELSLGTTLVPCGCDGGVLPSGQPCPDCGGSRFREVATPPPPIH